MYGQEKSGASTVRRLPDTAGSLLCVIPAITIPFLQTDLTPALDLVLAVGVSSEDGEEVEDEFLNSKEVVVK